MVAEARLPFLYALQVLAEYCPTVELSVTTLKRTAIALFDADPEVQLPCSEM